MLGFEFPNTLSDRNPRRKIDMIMPNQKSVDRTAIGARDACTREKVSFRMDSKKDSVRVGRFEMISEGNPKRRESVSKTTRGKSNVDMRLGEKIEGGRAKLTRWRIRM